MNTHRFARPDAQWSSRREFEDLILSLFSEDHLRTWIARTPRISNIRDWLPGRSTAKAVLVSDFADELLRRGQLDASLFELLIHEFPEREEDIRRVLSLYVAHSMSLEGSSGVSPLHEPDGRTSSDDLELAYRIRRDLLLRGSPTAEIDKKIRVLRRALHWGPQLAIGSYLHDGRYRLDKKTRTGRFFTSWKAYDRERQGIVLVKVMHGHLATEKDLREQLGRGSHDASVLQHPSIVQVLRGMFEEDVFCAYVVEYSGGYNLHDHVLQSSRNLGGSELIHIFVPVCEALQYAHERGIVRQSLNPSNVLFAAPAGFQLTDFGTVQARGVATGMPLSDFFYLAPEILGDTTSMDMRSVVYSVGMLMLLCLRGRPPDLESLVAPASVLSQARCSEPLKDLIIQALAHDPAKRVESVAALRERLQSFAASRPTFKPHHGPIKAVPLRLSGNLGVGFRGCIVGGTGFILTREGRRALVSSDQSNDSVISPYVDGEDVSSDSDQGFHRYAINFREMDLTEAERWPNALEVLRKRVKPERERDWRPTHAEFWWRFIDTASALRLALEDKLRCLVTTLVSKHHAFAFYPAGYVFSRQVAVCALESMSAFATLQSRVHEFWVLAFSAVLNGNVRYSIRDNFETFPFPNVDPNAELPALTAIGERLYTTRAAYMQANRKGLTRMYNALKDPACDDPAVIALRTLHLDLDRAVLAVYGWSDLAPLIPPYTTPQTPAGRRTVETFEDAVLDRLFALNATRAAAEARQPPPTKPPASAPKPTKGKRSSPAPSAQGSSLPDDDA